MKSWRIVTIALLLCVMVGTGHAQGGKLQLSWPSAEDAVRYELEIATVPLTGDRPAPDDKTVYRTTAVYTPGVELSLDLFDGRSLAALYYRVRPLDYDQKPGGPFSAPAALTAGTVNPTKPRPTAYFERRTPLYPVYSWIPVLGAEQYEIEITDRVPENPNGTEPSRYRIRSYTQAAGFDYYEQQPYTKAGVYYWRVLARDGDGYPLGGYSDAVPFTVTTKGFQWAVFGDSITQGGGAISNPPSDERFDYSSYLPVAAKNLGRSGDTAAVLAERFDRDVLPFQPKYLLVLGGINSIRAGTGADAIIASLVKIKQKCRARGITPIFLTLPPINPERIERVYGQATPSGWREELDRVNAFIRTQPYFVDLYPELADADGLLPVEYSQDGLHPDISGKRIIAQAVQRFIAEGKLKG